MKKCFGVLLALLAVVLVCAQAEDLSPEALTVAELNSFTHSLVERALEDGLQPLREDGGFVARGDGYTLLFPSGDLSADTALSGAFLVPGMDGRPVESLREIPVGESVDVLLSAFPNDNPSLVGTVDNAVLYMRGELPLPVSVGLVTREGQDLRLVEYSVTYAADQGFLQSGIQYTLDNGRITAIRYFGSSETVSSEEVSKALGELSVLQEETVYFAYDTDHPGPLEREDLTLLFLDFLDLSPEAAATSLGPPVHEERIEDSTGEIILIQQWEAVEIAFTFDAEGGFLLADRFTVSAAGVEGPRGIRIGNSLSMVLMRFEHGEGALPQESAVLYGDPDGQTAPFGLLTVGDGAALLHYAVKTEEETQVVLICSFIDDMLVEMSLSHL